MKTNTLPKYDTTDNSTNCCPRFHPEEWDQQELHFENKTFLKEKTRSFFHIPLNLHSVYSRTAEDMEKAGVDLKDNFVVLSHDLSPWRAEHLFATSKEVPGHETVTLTGKFLTKVFEGPHKSVPQWTQQMKGYAHAQGFVPGEIYFFHTTCPKCAKVYGKNYVVAIAKIG